MREIYLEIKNLIKMEEFTISELRLLDSFYYNSSLKKKIEIRARMFAESELVLTRSEMEMNKMLDRNKDKQYEVLRWVFDKVDGHRSNPINLVDFITENSKYTRDELERISDYLEGKGLIERVADEEIFIQLTHKGIVEIQNSINNPQNPTEHFPTQVIQYFNAPVGSVQTGNQNIANVQQNFGTKTEDVIELLTELREHIFDDKKQEGMEYIEGLEVELKSKKPSESRTKLFLKGLGEVIKDTGKEILADIGKKLITGEMQLPN
jgi:DNA-binding MarR family transcriptional regulator